MRTDDLIHRLSATVQPVPASQVPRLLVLGLGAGAVLSAIVMTASIGLRHDLLHAMGGGAFWMKFVYTFAVAALSLKLVDVLLGLTVIRRP